MEPTTTLPQEPEKTRLNEESLERQPGKLEVQEAMSTVEGELSKVQGMREKLKKPTLGVSLVIFLILNIVMFFVGVTTTKDCPKRPIIPIYLAVAGAIGIVTKITPIANRNKNITILNRIVYFLLFVEFIWMILGSYWIYSVYEPSYNPSDGNEYCNKTAYLMAFWLLTLHYIYILLLLAIPCCALYCCCAAILCCGKQALSSD